VVLLPSSASWIRLTERANPLRMRTLEFAAILEVSDNRGEFRGGVLLQKPKTRLRERTVQHP
jgi:hypothetical protein